MAYKRCTVCGLEANTEEELVDFKLKRKATFGRDCICKKCHNIKSKKYSQENKESRLTKSRKAYKEKPRKPYNWAAHIYKNYNVTEEWYMEQLEKQQGSCKICNIIPEKERLCVDHNHDTGEVRGLLCRSCNLLIGHSKEKEKILMKAVDYIKEYN